MRKFLLLLFLCIVFLTAEGKPKKKNIASSPLDKKLKNKKEEYKKTKCNHLGEDFQFNCIMYYVSPECFRKVFGEYGLDLGELPMFTKENEFNDCFKKSN